MSSINIGEQISIVTFGNADEDVDVVGDSDEDVDVIQIDSDDMTVPANSSDEEQADARSQHPGPGGQEGQEENVLDPTSNRDHTEDSWQTPVIPLQGQGLLQQQ
ncbi:hypothetical protein FRC10_008587 [Ceratobasidium sp. 414]|nr:hypothetical protein FRC10_008587 [Ceratobasidium sp. 414]